MGQIFVKELGGVVNIKGDKPSDEEAAAIEEAVQLRSSAQEKASRAIAPDKAKIPTDPAAAFSGGWEKGVGSSIFGPIQFILEKLSPSAAKTFSDIVKAKNQVLEQQQSKHETTGAVGEFGGAAAPYVAGGAAVAPESFAARLLMATGVGAVAGGTQFREEESQEDRDAARLRGAAFGAVAGPAAEAAGTGAGRLAAKIGNSKQIGKLLTEIKGIVKDFDPNVNEIAGNFAKRLESTEERLKTLYSSQDTIGNRLPAVEGSELGTLAKTELEALGKRADSDGRVRGMLSRIADRASPKEQKIPDDVAKLGPGFRDQVLKQLGLEEGGKKQFLKYGDVRGMAQDLNTYLSGKTTKELDNPSLQALRRVKNKLDEMVETYHGQSSQLSSVAKKSAKYHDDYVKPLQDPDFKDVMEGTPLDRMKAAVKIALSGDDSKGEMLARMMGPSAREDVRNGVIRKSLDDAVNSKGDVDPAKFQKIISDASKSFDYFKDRSFDVQLKGVQNLLEEHALATGVAARGGSDHSRAGGLLAILGLSRIATGDIKHGAEMIAGGAAENTIYRVVNNMLQSVTGKHYLMAASRAKPGTPRSAQLLNKVGEMFGAATEGATAGANEGPSPD